MENALKRSDEAKAKQAEVVADLEKRLHQAGIDLSLQFAGSRLGNKTWIRLSVASLQSKCKSLEAENEDLKSQNESLRKQSKYAGGKPVTGKQELDAIQNASAARQTVDKEKHEQITSLKEEIVSLKQELSERSEELEKVTKESEERLKWVHERFLRARKFEKEIVLKDSEVKVKTAEVEELHVRSCWRDRCWNKRSVRLLAPDARVGPCRK